MDQRIVLYTRQNLNQCGLMSIIQMKSFKVILMNESTSDRQAREAGIKPFNKQTCEYEERLSGRTLKASIKESVEVTSS